MLGPVSFQRFGSVLFGANPETGPFFLHSELLGKEGWLRHRKRCCEATFDGADGVVNHRLTMTCERPFLLASPNGLAFASLVPGRSFQRRLRSFLLRSRPPLLYQEG